MPAWLRFITAEADDASARRYWQARTFSDLSMYDLVVIDINHRRIGARMTLWGLLAIAAVASGMLGATLNEPWYLPVLAVGCLASLCFALTYSRVLAVHRHMRWLVTNHRHRFTL